MANILYKSIQNINDGDEEAFVEIISKFYLMIKKFAKELKYEEAETDLIIYFIEIIKEIKIENLNIEHDEIDRAIISYIYNSMKNNKIDLFRKYVKGVKEAQEISNAGMDVVAVYEAGGSKPRHFTHSNGYNDCMEAVSRAGAIGQPYNSAIYFAVDTDMRNNLSAVYDYFHGVSDAMIEYYHRNGDKWYTGIYV